MMKGFSKWSVLFFLCLAALSLLFFASSGTSPSVKASTDDDSDGAGTWYVYNVKFVCGSQPMGMYNPVVPGIYATSINLHKWVVEYAYIHKKAVVAVPQKTPQLEYGFDYFEMCWDYAFRIDCEDIIWNLLQIQNQVDPAGNPLDPNAFYEGYVSLISPVPLDVEGVYTSHFANSLTLDIEHVEARLMPDIFDEGGDWPPDWPKYWPDGDDEEPEP